MNLNFWLLSSSICLFIKLTSAHLDQRCNFSMCLNSIFGPIQHAYCDSNNRCRCKDGYVPVSHHRCAEAQYPGNRCENDNVCRSKDENSFCDSNRRDPICECKKSYIFDPEQKKCILFVKKPKKSTPLFPMTAIVLIACIGIFCGCGIICHNFRRQPELSVSIDHIERYASGRRQASNHHHGDLHHSNLASSSRTNNNSRNNSSDPDMPLTNPPLLQPDSHSISSKYDSLMYDDPPPPYEDAINEYHDSVVIESPLQSSSSTNNNNTFVDQQQVQQTTIGFCTVEASKS
ncbi:uncharacterized protein LOC113799524 [Dermatophagoides pteronyssinus]|uniref:uncharacterized protein LOC113799524 n=1 Tax=Dermatophagoides pteronyssinus TaxID=6956 RepID=UPI003F681440